mmetsp:Transcript_144195/g.461714  ORF Transcript_144195/g.461714 Transcript_144195/m.461714 type:complete len:306 (-) Transcript_144195:89-1006(-)
MAANPCAPLWRWRRVPRGMLVAAAAASVAAAAAAAGSAAWAVGAGPPEVPRRWPLVGGLLQVVGLQQAAVAAEGASGTSPKAAAAIAEFLNTASVYAVTDESGAPVLEPDPDRPGKFVGKFYMEPEVAEQVFARLKKERAGAQALEVRRVPMAEVYVPFVADGKEEELGGQLRIEPVEREMRHSRQMLDGNPFGPPGSVPLFLCTDLTLQGQNPPTEPFTPAFVFEKDLRSALKRAGAKPENKGGPKVQLAMLQTIVDQIKANGGNLSPPIRVVDHEYAETIADMRKQAAAGAATPGAALAPSVE